MPGPGRAGRTRAGGRGPWGPGWRAGDYGGQDVNGWARQSPARGFEPGEDAGGRGTATGPHLGDVAPLGRNGSGGGGRRRGGGGGGGGGGGESTARRPQRDGPPELRGEVILPPIPSARGVPMDSDEPPPRRTSAPHASVAAGAAPEPADAAKAGPSRRAREGRAAAAGKAAAGRGRARAAAEGAEVDAQAGLKGRMAGKPR